MHVVTLDDPSDTAEWRAKARTLLLLPSARHIVSWRASHRAILASTHPLSGRVGTAHGSLPSNHVFAVVGAERRRATEEPLEEAGTVG